MFHAFQCIESLPQYFRRWLPITSSDSPDATGIATYFVGVKKFATADTIPTTQFLH
jgi:hypothetical protein